MKQFLKQKCNKNIYDNSVYDIIGMSQILTLNNCDVDMINSVEYECYDYDSGEYYDIKEIKKCINKKI